MRLQNNKLTLGMTAIGGNQPITIRAEVRNPFSGPTFWFDVKGDSFSIDENLFRALPKEPKDVQTIVRSLNPGGSFNFYFQATREVPGQPSHHHLVLDLNRCSIRYQKFPYPISNITGKLVMFDDQWNFFKLEGFNNSACITGEGSFRPTMEGNQLELQLTECERALDNAVGAHSRLFRPPHGGRRPDVLATVRRLGFTPIMWSATGYDWSANNPAEIEANISRQVRGGDVILLHDGGHLNMGIDRSATIAATDRLVQRYKDEGFQFVTIPEMMDANG
jgi:hypothetical protein